MVSGNYAADPAWGAYGQLSSAQQLGEPFNQAKQSNLRWITWVEAFGECMLYAAAFERRPDGSFLQYDGSPGLAQLSRSAWGWESGQSGNNLNDLSQPIFVLAALVVPEARWLPVEKELLAAVATFFPPPRPDRPATPHGRVTLQMDTEQTIGAHRNIQL